MPPTVVVEVALRSLASTEFGYRAHDKWGYTQQGSVSICLKKVESLQTFTFGVRALLEDEWKILKQAVAIAPDIKWIIVGGSPCQDLICAGPFQGLLGLVW